MPNNEDQILSKLESIIGKENVLTELEHLYVYSHFGEFGIKVLKNPLAVVRTEHENDEFHVMKLLSDLDIPVIRNDNWKKVEGFKGTFLILDTQKPVTIEELEKRLNELDEENDELKQNLKEVPSFSQWMTSSLRRRDGYRLWERDEDIGFCVVQSFFNHIQTYSSKGRFLLAKGILNGDLKESALLSDSIYNCTACGQCYDQVSLDSLEVNNLIIKTRKKIVQQGNAPKKFNSALNNILLHRNPAGLPSEDRILWIEEKVNKHPYEDNPILFWPGCTTSYRLPELVEDTCEILNTAGYDFGLLGESEGCCGLIMYLSGHWDEAKSNAEKRLEQLGDISRLVTNCSGCYYCFSKVYPRLGLTVPFEVVHTSHIIKESIKEDRLKLNEYKGTYIWHDPCDLGRHSQVYEPPRYVLNSIPGLKLLESSLNREHTICCGAGGGLWMYNEELTNHVSWIKITKTVPEKIDGIITGCPTCLISIRNTVREITPNLRVFDIVEVVKNSI